MIKLKFAIVDENINIALAAFLIRKRNYLYGSLRDIFLGTYFGRISYFGK